MNLFSNELKLKKDIQEEKDVQVVSHPVEALVVQCSYLGFYCRSHGE